MAQAPMFRINQFSKDLGVKPKEMQKYLVDAGLGEMSPSATLEPEDASLLLTFLTEAKQIKDLDGYVSGRYFAPSPEREAARQSCSM